jgi:hypothetical protein
VEDPGHGHSLPASTSWGWPWGTRPSVGLRASVGNRAGVSAADVVWHWDLTPARTRSCRMSP